MIVALVPLAVLGFFFAPWMLTAGGVAFAVVFVVGRVLLAKWLKPRWP